LLASSPTRVDHVDHVVDGDTGLGQVGGQNDFAPVRAHWLEHAMLLPRGELGMQGQDDEAPLVAEHRVHAQPVPHQRDQLPACGGGKVEKHE
jgi:hypothetical protein